MFRSSYCVVARQLCVFFCKRWAQGYGPAPTFVVLTGTYFVLSQFFYYQPNRPGSVLSSSLVLAEPSLLIPPPEIVSSAELPARIGVITFSTISSDTGAKYVFFIVICLNLLVCFSVRVCRRACGTPTYRLL